MRITRLQFICLVLISAFIFGLGLFLKHLQPPYYVGEWVSPAYPNLFNSLNLLNLTAPNQFEHPGTTLQLFGAALCGLNWVVDGLINGWRTLNDAVFSDTEYYLTSINVGLTYLLGGSLLVLGVRMTDKTNVLWAFIGFVATLLMYNQFFYKITGVSSSLLLISIMVWVATCLMSYLAPSRSEDLFLKRRHATKLALILGIGLATDLMFLPMLALLLLAQGWGNRIKLLIVCMVSFLMFSFPIFLDLDSLLRWLVNILSLKGIVATSGGMSAVSVFLDNGKLLVRHEPLLMLSLMAYLLGNIMLRIKLKNRQLVTDTDAHLFRLRRLLGAASVALILQYLMVMTNPSAHFLLPGMVLTAFINAALIYTYFRLDIRRFLNHMFFMVGVAVLAVGLLINFTHLVRLISHFSAERAQSSRVEKLLLKNMNCFPAGFGTNYIYSSALYFGNSWSGRHFTDILITRFPNSYVFREFQNTFYDFEKKIFKKQIVKLQKQGHCFLVQSNDPLPDDSVKFFTPIYPDDDETKMPIMYRLKDLTKF